MQTLTQEQVAKLEQELAAQGWTRQFTAFPNRVQEYVDLYGAMGMEVHVEDWALSSEPDPSCGQCVILGLMKTIFTRKKSTS